MEDENKKERKCMKRTHNDAVRELVAFVRKRDKRLAAHQAEEAKRRMQREEENKLRFCQCSEELSGLLRLALQHRNRIVRLLQGLLLVSYPTPCAPGATAPGQAV